MTLSDPVPSGQYQRFFRWLKKTYPLKTKGVKIEVKLEDKLSIPFVINGETKEAEATVALSSRKVGGKVQPLVLIRVAIANPRKSLFDHYSDIAHEVCHVHQYFDRGARFNTCEYYEDPLEIEAKLFGAKAAKLYLKEIGV